MYLHPNRVFLKITERRATQDTNKIKHQINQTNTIIKPNELVQITKHQQHQIKVSLNQLSCCLIFLNGFHKQKKRNKQLLNKYNKLNKTLEQYKAQLNKINDNVKQTENELTKKLNESLKQNKLIQQQIENERKQKEDY